MRVDSHGVTVPSPWVVRWTGLLRPDARVLDVACGSGRHLKWFSEHGHAVYGVDRDISQARENVPRATLTEADIELGPWPLMASDTPQQFNAVIVTNYLWRPLMGTLLASLAPGGVLIYETFAAGNETVGRPARPDFLLSEGELLDVCAGLRIVAYENGFLAAPDRFVQRIAAIKQPASETRSGTPVRYPV